VEKLQVLVSLKRRNRAMSLSLPLYYLYVGVAVVVGFLLFSGVLTSVALRRLTASSRLVELASENSALRDELAVCSAAIDSFRSFLAATEQMDNRIRAAVNLNLIPADIRLMGVGGGKTTTPMPSAEQLMRRIEFDAKSLAEVDAALVRQQDKLRTMPSIWPVQGYVVSGFGRRADPFTGSREMHYGLDVAAPAGTPIVAPADGRVVDAGWKGGMGKCVEIDHGYGIRTIFGHCRTLKVSDGQRVTRGQAIATVGATGRATGTHVHYGIKVNGNWTNPANYIISRLGD
jgi:murein DD-endopeptidase MepM/ murein hydrolase activator NlpD